MPASAMAAARYASPTGSGSACTLAAPCGLVTAVNSAQNGDDVTIEPGSYAVTNTLDDNGFSLMIHGQAGAARPVITNSSTIGMELLGAASSVSDLELDITSSSNPGLIAASSNDRVDRVFVKVTNSSNSDAACDLAGTMTDSVCWTNATNGIAVLNSTLDTGATVTLRNDTLDATGGGNSVGVRAAAAAAGAHPSIALVNSIAHGLSQDVLAENAGGDSAVVTADHSNFATSMATGSGASVPAPGSGTNQTSSPQFVNAVSGDFHELAASPTVDAGVDSVLNGSLDFDGLPRTMGAHTDIGAFEYPVTVCQPASANTPFGKAVNVQLQCADPSGAPITSYTVVTPPSHGSVSVNSTGTASYTPASGYSGPDTFTFDATSAHGAGAPATATVTVALPVPPQLTQVKQSHPRWREGRKLARFASGTNAVGTTFRFTLSESATVQFAFKQQKCRRRCAKGTLTYTAGAGAHKLRFQGRLSKHKKLPPGRYTLTITATNAAGQRATAKLNFTIVKE